MLEYLCLDGPLAGAVVESDEDHGAGEVIALEVTDVGSSDDSLFDYRVQTPATDVAGELRFVGVRPRSFAVEVLPAC